MGVKPVFKDDPIVNFSEKRVTYKDPSSPLTMVYVYGRATINPSVESGYVVEATDRSLTLLENTKKAYAIPTLNSGSFEGTTSRSVAISKNLPILVFSGAFLSSSMVGGVISVPSPNISNFIPGDASDPTVFSNPSPYSGVIVKLINKNSAEVSENYYHEVSYVTTKGVSKRLVFDRFLNSIFTMSYYNPENSVSSQKLESFAELNIKDLTPLIGDVSKIKVKVKPMGSVGEFVELGSFDVRPKSKLVDTGSFTTDLRKGLLDKKIGTFKSDSDVTRYLVLKQYYRGIQVPVTGSISYSADRLLDAVSIVNNNTDQQNNKIALSFTSSYLQRAVENTQYRVLVSYYTDYRDNQIDLYVSGANVVRYSSVNKNPTVPQKDRNLGTYLGSLSGKDGNISKKEIVFNSLDSGFLDLKFVVVKGNWHLSNIDILSGKKID